MNKKIITSGIGFLILGVLLTLNSCSNKAKKKEKNKIQNTVYANDVSPFFENFKLVLGDGSNVGIPNNFENKDFFYTENEGENNWVVFKAPNAGSTHGTS
ncbi:polysaccharide lyase family 7 protein, partial [Bacteroidota bacterium]